MCKGPQGANLARGVTLAHEMTRSATAKSCLETNFFPVHARTFVRLVCSSRPCHTSLPGSNGFQLGDILDVAKVEWSTSSKRPTKGIYSDV